MNIGFDENTAKEEFIIDIRDKNQVIKHRYALNSKDIEKNILMSEHYIQLEEFALDVFIKFERTDYIIWEGEKYMIKEDYIPDQVNKFNYKYTLRFDHWTTFLRDDTFYYMNQGLEEADWSLMSNAATHFQLIADNANRYFGVNTFNVGTIEFAEMKLLQFSKVSIWDAATQIADAYKAEWYLTGTTFHLVKKFSYGSEVDFEAEVSVEKMDRSEGENSEKYTRILSFGSTRNIPANYRETTPTEAVDAIYQKRLRIPQSKGNFIDIRPNLSPEEVKSAVVIFDDIYPKRIGTMSSISIVEYTETDETTGVVTKWNTYRYKDTGLSFKEKYRLPEIELRIVFQSGVLNGTDYEVKFNPLGKAETDPESQLFEIIRNEDYGKALPNNTLKPQNGDTFILYGFDIKLVSDQYIPAGEQELFDKATEWLTENNRDKSVFDCPTMMQYFEDNEMDLEIGQKVKLIHSQFESGFRSSRIQGYEKHLLDKYQATYTVGDNAAYSWPKDIEESIKELQIAGVTYQATGRNGVYLITRFDNTPPSDYNAYSAKASDARYLNRISGGTVQGDTTFQKKVKAKEVISDQFGNETFTSGQFGNGFRTWLAANGQSYAEFDNLMIRREMIINTLTIAQIKSVGGQILLSLANMYCNGVTDGGTYWKCTFDTANGTITNQFAVDDQVICRKFNGANIKYYWAKVTSIGSDYINLSKSDKDGTGIPAINDEIIQFGNRTNASRQSAIMLSAYGSDAPSIKQYAGINSYNLTGKEVTVISPSGNKFTGDFTIQSSGTNVTTAIDNAKNTAISTAATDTTNKVNALQIGGSNLFRDSANFGSPYWASRAYVTLLNEYYRECRIYRTSIAWSAMTYKNYDNINLSKEHTISFYVKSDVDLSSQTGNLLSYGIANGRVISAINKITTDWQRLSITGSLTGDVNGIRVELSTNINSGYIYFCGFKLEEGNKATTWTPAPEDVQANIDAANTAANNAATAASNAQTSANTANSLLADIANDNLLIPSEKQDVLKEWQIIQGEYPTVVAQATTYSVSSSDYTAKYNALNTYITPLLSSMTTNSAIVGTTFRSTFKAYYDAKIALLKLVTDKAKTIADASQSSADTANAGLLSKVAYSEYNAQMQIQNDKIASKVSQNDFNALGQRVGTTESRQTQQAGQITSVVETVDNLNIEGRNLIIRYNEKANTIVDESGSPSPLSGSNLMDGFISVTAKESLSFSKYGSNAPDDSYFRFAYFKEDGVTVVSIKAIATDKFKEVVPAEATLLRVSYPAKCQVKIEGGYKVTGWALSPEDVQAGIDNAQSTANKAQKDANGANSLLADIANDNKLVPNEKQETKKEWDIIVSEYPKNIAQANKFSVSTTAYTNAYNALSSYITPLLANLGTTSDINSTTFRATFKAYYDARTDLLNAISTKAKDIADSKTTVHYQDAQPTSPKVGDIWQMQTYTNINGVVEVDTTKNVCRIEKRWNGTAWILINVNASGSYVTKTNDSITSIVTKTGIDSLGTGETLKSLIDQTPTQIQLAVSAVRYDPKNLVLNSSVSRIVPIGNTSNDIADIPFNAGDVVSFGCDVSFEDSDSINQILLIQEIDVNNVRVHYEWSNENTSPTGSGVFKRISGTHIMLNNGYFRLGLRSNGTTSPTTFKNIKIENSSKPTKYTSAPEDIQAEIVTAQTAATNAATAASNADAKATTANNLLTDIANDNKLDPAEKQSTKKEWDIIVSEYSKNIAQANSFTVSTTVYTSAYNALSSYITPLLSNLNTTSDIVGTTFRSNFKSYYDARTDLLNAVSTKAKAIADSKTDLDTVKAGITINADGITAFGDQFKVDSLLIANAIQTQALNVGDGNFLVGTDGKMSAKGASIEGVVTSIDANGNKIVINAANRSIRLYTSENDVMGIISYNTDSNTANNWTMWQSNMSLRMYEREGSVKWLSSELVMTPGGIMRVIYNRNGTVADSVAWPS